MIYITPHFSYKELTRTDTGLENEPSDEETGKLFYLATYILEPIRKRWGRYHTNSCFRSRLVNEAVGGEDDSQHRLAEAHDGYPMEAGIQEVFRWIVEVSGIMYGQVIYEEDENNGEIISWIHISMPRRNKVNLQSLIFKNGVYTPYQETSFVKPS